MDIFSVAVTLFLIMDPIGNIASLVSLTEKIPTRRRYMIIVREMLIALAIMIAFNYIGEFIFNVLQISESTLRLTVGILLFLIAIKILFPSEDSMRANLPQGEPFISPVAVPLIAGPSLLAAIMLFAHLEPNSTTMLYAILAAWLVALAIMMMSRRLKIILGINGLMACERLMGMVLVMISIQRILDGVQYFVKNSG